MKQRIRLLPLALAALLAAGVGHEIYLAGTRQESSPFSAALLSLNGLARLALGQSYVDGDLTPPPNAVQIATVRLRDGSLGSPVLSAPDMTPAAARTIAFQKALAAQGIPFLYVQAPGDVAPEDPRLPPGLTENGNAAADAFLAALDGAGVTTLDLRGGMAAQFFATDHHWRPGAALEAAQQTARQLQRSGIPAAADALDPVRFPVRRYPRLLLGSEGKRAGLLFAGADDFDLPLPDFSTDLTVTIDSGGLQDTEADGPRRGSFSASVLHLGELVRENRYQSRPYQVFFGGSWPRVSVINAAAAEGYILLIGDSFTTSFGAYLSLGVHRLEILDPRLYPDGIQAFALETQPDAVVLLHNTGSMFTQGLYVFS
ncbi:MAG: hypothetical protein LBJ11_06435 [Oscillospiraceae bacterium]|jgi:hypothetical protein|nr:hypothetical protein [Oscillospiraceae bacterium]